MEEGGPPIDWRTLNEAGKGGRLMELLVKLPRELWAHNSKPLLLSACRGPNVAAVVALVQSGPMDVNAEDTTGYTTAHYAAVFKQTRVLEVLCAAGADLRARTNHGESPIDVAITSSSGHKSETVRMLVANGVRLNTVREGYRCYITPELEAFECGVLCCRAAVVAMLRVKRAGKLWMWDKFLLAELAVCVWATRYAREWSLEEV